MCVLRSWSEPQQLTVSAVDDEGFSALELVVEIDFAVKSVDARYHNVSVETLSVHIWDDDAPRETEGDEREALWMDERVWLAAALFGGACLCVALSRVNRRYRAYMQWKAHNDLLRIHAALCLSSYFSP